MADPTKYAQAIVPNFVLAQEIADYLRENIVMLALVNTVPFVKGVTSSVKQRKKGNFTAETAAEATSATRQQYAQTALPTLTVQMAQVYSELSWLANDYSPITPEEMKEAAGKAIMEYVEDAILSLASGFSNNVGTYGQDLTPAVFKEATLTLEIANVKGRYAAIFHPTQIANMTDYIQESSASVWASPNIGLSLLNGQAPQVNGLKGQYLDVPIFSTTNVQSVNSDADWGGMICSPKEALSYGEDGRGIIHKSDEDIQAGVLKMSDHIFFDAKERDDAAGVEVRSVK